MSGSKGAGPALTRRRFLRAAAGAGAVAAVGAAAPFATVVAAGALGATQAAEPAAAAAPAPAPGPACVPFHGVHQAGIDRPVGLQAATVMAAFDVVSTNREELRALFAELTVRSRDLALARLPEPTDRLFPPNESGILASTASRSRSTSARSAAATSSRCPA
jgi:hypothetical protein